MIAEKLTQRLHDARRGALPRPLLPPSARRPPHERNPHRSSYRDRVGEVPMLHRVQVEAMWDRYDNPAVTVRSLRRGGHLLGMRIGGDWEFPQFQFDAGAPLPKAVYLNLLLGAGLKPWPAFRWWTMPRRVLHGRAPMDVLDDPELDPILVDLATNSP
jgi:hypothetical protein